MTEHQLERFLILEEKKRVAAISSTDKIQDINKQIKQLETEIKIKYKRTN